MSLRTKFAILLATLAAAVVIALAVARWSLDVTYREVREPVKSASTVLQLLVAVEKEIDILRARASPESEAFQISGPGRDDVDRAQLDRTMFVDTLNRVERQLATLDPDTWTAYAGKSAVMNLDSQISRLRSMGAILFEDQSLRERAVDAAWRSAFPRDPDPITDAVTTERVASQLFRIHELLKLMEQRVVVDIQKLAETSADLRTRLSVVLGLALLLVFLTGTLAFSLVRRWVVGPVADLRTAALRIASGDFEHRVPIPERAPADEMTALSTEINHMAAMIRRMQTEQIEQERLAAIGELVRRLAHNLRNPLAGIRSLAELTRSDAAGAGEAADDVRESQTRIIATVDRFEQWLSDLLRVTKPTQVEHVEADPRAWLAGLVDAHRPYARTHGVKLELAADRAPPTAHFDPSHLEQAVTAIIANALQAAAGNPTVPPEDRRVRVVVEPARDGNTGLWEIRIEDTGPGVPPDLRESIFKPYFTTKADGNGIGLAVAQQIVRSHGGEIRVEDRTNGSGGPESSHASGATFVIRLPLAKSGQDG